MPCTLYLSPHLDDAVLSCAGGLCERTRRGDRVVVATVFSHGTEESHAHRRSEDERALAAAGAEARHLGLLDAPFRGIEASFPALTGTALDPELVRVVRERIRSLVIELEPQEVWLPAAIGGHVDHRTVFEARDAAGERARLYADRPYAFVEPLVLIRRHEIEGTASGPLDADELHARLTRAGVMSAFLAPAAPVLRASFARARAQTGLSFEVRRHHFPVETLGAACALVDAYASQLEPLFGAPTSGKTYERLARDEVGWFEEEAVVRSAG